MSHTINYCTKQDLYNFINTLRKALKIENQEFPINLYEVCKNIKSIKIALVNFSDKSLRGMAFPKDKIILLNSNRNPKELNFDCSHELIHIVKHRNQETQSFNCTDSIKDSQNSYLEWQANEGAAELLVPYKKFIPLLCKGLDNISTSMEFDNLKSMLATYFNVPDTVIKLRINNLSHEIIQFQKGVDIDFIELKSTTQLKKEGTPIYSLNTYYEFMS